MEKTIGVVSGKGGVGKTTFIADVGLSLIELEKDVSKLQQAVTRLASKNFDVKLENLSKSISSETKSLMKQITENAEVIFGLRDKLQYFESVVKDLSEKLESQTKLSNKIVGSKEFLLKKSEAIAAELKPLTKEISSERERIAKLEQELKDQSKEQGSKIKELEGLVKDMGSLEERISDSEKLISHMSEAVTEMRTRIMDEEGIAKKFEEQSKVIDKVTNAGERLTRLEENTKAQVRDQDLRFSEVIAVIKDLELGEAKRIKEFDNFVERFQKLRLKTEQNLTLFSQNMKKLSDIKSEIKSEISRENASKFKEFGSEFSGIKNRANATEGLIAQLNDTIEELRLNMKGLAGRTKPMEDVFTNVSNLIRDMKVDEAKRITEYNKFIEEFQGMKAKADETIKSIKTEANLFKKMNMDFASRETKINDKINAFKEEIDNRIKINEGMYDSEMDEFKNRLDYIIKELVACKKMQQDFYGILRGSGKEKAEETVTTARPTRTEKTIIKKSETKPIPYQESP